MVQNTHAHAERGRIVKTDINVAVDDVYSLFLVDATVRVCIFMYWTNNVHIHSQTLTRTRGVECYYLLRNKRAIAFDNNVFSRAVHQMKMKGMGEWYSIISA